MNSKKKIKKLTPSKLTNVNQKMEVNLEDSDDESIYLPPKYPKDDIYKNFVNNFKIMTQDKLEAGTSNESNSQKKNINNQINQNEELNCGKCYYKFSKKSYSIGCFKCSKWYCLTCAHISKKELSEIKKSKQKWLCVLCNKNIIIDEKVTIKNISNIEEENILFKKIIHDLNEKIKLLSQKLELFEKANYLKIDQIENKIDTLIQKFDETNKKIPSKELYSEILTKKAKHTGTTNLPVLIIKPKTTQSSQKTKKEVQENVNPVAINVSVNKVKNIRNGGIIIKSNSKEEIQNLEQLSKKKLNENYTVQISQLKPPKLVMIGSRKEYQEHELINELRRTNHIDKDDKIYIKGMRKSNHSSKYIIYINTIGSTFAKLVNKEISMGWDKCKFKEAFDINVCFKCCQYGHKANNCTKKQICKFCSLNHCYWSCTSEELKCVNCTTSNKQYNTNYDYLHEANSNQCPIHDYVIEKIKEKINYDYE